MKESESDGVEETTSLDGDGLTFPLRPDEVLPSSFQ